MMRLATALRFLTVSRCGRFMTHITRLVDDGARIRRWKSSWKLCARFLEEEMTVYRESKPVVKNYKNIIRFTYSGVTNPRREIFFEKREHNGKGLVGIEVENTPELMRHNSGRKFGEIDRMGMMQQQVGRQTVWSTRGPVPVSTAEGFAGSTTDVLVVFDIPIPRPAHTSRPPPRDNSGSCSVSFFRDGNLAEKSHLSAIFCHCLRPHREPLDLSIGLFLPLSIHQSTNPSIDLCQLDSIPFPCESISVN